MPDDGSSMLGGEDLAVENADDTLGVSCIEPAAPSRQKAPPDLDDSELYLHAPQDELVAVAAFDLRFEHLDFEKVISSATICRELLIRVRTAIVEDAHAANEENVEVELMYGMVLACSLCPGTVASAEAFKASVDSGAAELLQRVEAAVQQVDRIEEVTSSNVRSPAEGLGLHVLRSSLRFRLLTTGAEEPPRTATASTAVPDGETTLATATSGICSTPSLPWQNLAGDEDSSPMSPIKPCRLSP